MQRISRSVAKLWRNESCRAAFILVFLLNVLFFSCLWGGRTLLQSAEDAPSILFQGAWAGRHGPERLHKIADPGASAWLTEPWLSVQHDQYFREHTLPLWNPYQGYGQP